MPATDLSTQWVLDLARFDANEQARVVSLLKRMEKELLAKVAAGTTDWSKSRISQQVAEINAIIQRYYDVVASHMVDTSTQLAQISATSAGSALSTLMDGAASILPAESVLRALATDVLIVGAPQKAWWEKQSIDVAFRFQAAFRQGIAAAETSAQLVKRIHDQLDVSRTSAAALVQTGMTSVANEARMSVFAANSDVVTGVKFLATLDSKTCQRCGALDGMTWKLDGTPIKATLPFTPPPPHFNCLTGDSLVSSTGDVTGISKRWFDGEVVVIQTAESRKLTSTPNHPILTRRGWVAAGLLDIGGDVICDGFSERRTVGDGNHENVPPTIHDFIESFLSTRQVSATPMPVTTGDFHGDGVGSKVAVVYSESLLGYGFDTSSAKHIREDKLKGRLQTAATQFFGFCRSFKTRTFGWLAPDRVMVVFEKSKSFFLAHCAPPGKLLFASVAEFNPSTSQGRHQSSSPAPQSESNTRYATTVGQHGNCARDVDGGSVNPGGVNVDGVESTLDSLGAYAELASKLANGDSGKVLIDNIVNIERHSFHGYVYNLETDKGWYVANSIITHNCRCVLAPQTMFSGLGSGQRASDQGPVDRKTTFEDFLAKKSDTWQDDNLGKGRAAMWRDGKITLKDLTSGTGRPLTLEALRAKYK